MDPCPFQDSWQAKTRPLDPVLLRLSGRGRRPLFQALLALGVRNRMSCASRGTTRRVSFMRRPTRLPENGPRVAPAPKAPPAITVPALQGRLAHLWAAI